MDVGHFADGISHAGEHGVEGEEILDHHGLGGELDLEEAEVEEGGLVQDEVGAGQEGDGDGGEGEHFEDGVGEGVDLGDADAFSVEALGFEEEASAFVAFHGVRLDEADSLEAFLEDFIDVGHALQGAADGAFEGFADAVGGESGDGYDDEGEAGEAPVEPEGAGEEADDAKGLSDHLGEEGVEALGDGVDVVGEAGHELGGALVGEAGQIQLHGASEEEVAEVEEGELGDGGDEDVLGELEDAFDGDSGHDEGEEEAEGTEAVAGEVAGDEGFDPVKASEVLEAALEGMGGGGAALIESGEVAESGEVHDAGEFVEAAVGGGDVVAEVADLVLRAGSGVIVEVELGLITAGGGLAGQFDGVSVAGAEGDLAGFGV